MAQTVQPIKTPMSVQRKLSVAVGILSFLAFILSQISKTWGFEPVANQIVETMLIVSGAISIYFGSATVQKEITEREDEEDK